MITKNDYFIDIEVEGKYKGEKTLFIVDYYNILSIENIINENLGISQIYFGAGFQSEIKDYDIIRYFKQFDYIITIEVLLSQINTIPIDIIEDSRYHKIFTLVDSSNKYNYQNNITLKIENKKGIFSFIHCIYNSWKAYNNF